MNVYNININDLPLSRELKEACEQNGILTLSELLDLPVDKLMKMPSLNMSMIEELKQMIDRQRKNVAHDGDGKMW